MKNCVALGSYRTQTVSQNHPSRSCVAPKVRRPLSTAGHVPSRINGTMRPCTQSTSMRAFIHRTCLSGNHPTTHTPRNTALLPHHRYLRLSRSQLRSTRRTDTQQRRRHPTRGPSNLQPSPANSAQRQIRQPNHTVIRVIHTLTNNRLRRHTYSHMCRSRHSNCRHILHNGKHSQS